MHVQEFIRGSKQEVKIPVLEMKNISKTFSGVTVLDNVKIQLYPGEVHALMGENGAGKSTLMKILSGIYTPDENDGTIFYKGEQISWRGPTDARNKGISVIHQELSLSSNLTISENILMGSKFPRNRLGLVKWEEVHERAQKVLNSMGSNLNPRAFVSTLSIAQQQMVEIARALSHKAEVLIMDEPTASLTDKETTKLFKIVEDLKKQGVSIVYISHRMDEIFKISNRYTVLRDGRWIDSGLIEQTSQDHLVRLMVGRNLKELFQRHPSSTTPNSKKSVQPVLELRNISDNTIVKNVSFKIFPGEIVGLAGLVGAGRTELVRAVFGVSELKNGEIYVEGQRVEINSPIDAISQGIAHVPENRKEQGLFLTMSVKENILMAELKKCSKAGLVSWNKIDTFADQFIKELGIKAATPVQLVANLSGGNQQKVVIARWLSIAPKVLLLDEPTRGVDIGAKTEIHKIISKLADEGLAVLMISSELPEVLGVSDRILVMNEGKLKGELSKEEANQERIMYLATGGSKTI
ncbi:ribose transport system ATP-binding protein [Bacillus pakistanensis]|uniref:Ribose transport system ATP-binding protein n=1 Tax=Rossellomorea pakistanensis TaxID=992288 RepID=A0ABS2NE06_9BACI|nr:sugar ABC transporter ATP-binding protein [Bacillus pakistanensis]MBM7586045.1 ribose transport system ATP-binding protein [Bacillus pakistanensis]